MATLARLGPTLLIGGGSLMALLLLAMVVAPGSAAIFGFFLVAPAMGLGVLGLAAAAPGGLGRIGAGAAWLGAIGGVAVTVVGLDAIATDRFVTGVGIEDDPMAIPFVLTSMSWMVGSLGVALALVRGRAVRPVGAWLVLGGTVSAMVLGTILGEVAPGLSALSALPFALGWAVLGRDLAAGRRAASPVG
jgi:hypothetical protein